MSHSETRRPWRRALLEIVVAVVVPLLFIGIVQWGLTHRPVRRGEGPLPATKLAVQPTGTATSPPAAGAAEPTPLLGPNDVTVYTLDGRELCRGYPVGEMGYYLRCSAPAGVYLFRVVDAAGTSILAVRYNEQVLVRVGR